MNLPNVEIKAQNGQMMKAKQEMCFFHEKTANKLAAFTLKGTDPLNSKFEHLKLKPSQKTGFLI